MWRIGKKLTVLIFAVVLMILPSSLIIANAPRTQYIIDAVNTSYGVSKLRISSSGNAIVYALARADIKSSIEISVYLQRKVESLGAWTTLKTWKKHSNSTAAVLENSYRLYAKGTYRTMMNGIIKSKGKTETISATSDSSKY